MTCCDRVATELPPPSSDPDPAPALVASAVNTMLTGASPAKQAPARLLHDEEHARRGEGRRQPANRVVCAAATAGSLDLVPADLAEAHAAEDDVRRAERPLAAYAALAALFTVVFVVPLAIAGSRGSLPRRPRAGDVVLVGVGTFKLSRLLTHAAVTGFLRAPFVRFEGMEGLTTPKESPRGRGLRRAVGQLLLCSKCMGLWVAAALVTGLVRAPRATRVACTALAAATINDLLQTARKAASG